MVTNGAASGRDWCMTAVTDRPVGGGAAGDLGDM